MAEAKFYESYARFDELKGRYETWEEAVTRVMDMHRYQYADFMTPELKEYIDFAEASYKAKEVLGAQRALQFGGEQLLKHNARLFNCLKKDTKFVTNKGVKSFEDFSDGDPCVVRSHTGFWRKAKVKKYGVQKLNRIYFNKNTKDDYIVYATPNHRWMLKDETFTDNLKVGDRIRTVDDVAQYWEWEEATIKFNLNEGLRSKFDKPWKVVKIEENVLEEEVWCLEVEEDHTFTLPNGMITGNCSGSYVDRPEFFGECFYMMLCGCGVGFSVQIPHVAKLPKIQPRKKEPKTFIVPDSIEGWARALDVLLSSYFVGGGVHQEYEGHKVFFDLQEIRPKGSYISGGFKAPGSEPLRIAFDKIEQLLNSALKNKMDVLRPIDVYDITMYSADAVISGGVRRAATICLFSLEDQLMMKAKTGNWFVENPQRARSNNSVVLYRDTVSYQELNSIIASIKEYGEPGFVFSDDLNTVFNP